MSLLRAGLLWLTTLLLVAPGIQAAEAQWQTYASTFHSKKTVEMRETAARQQSTYYVAYLQDTKNVDHIKNIAAMYFHLEDYHHAAQWYYRVLELESDHKEASVFFAESLYLAGALAPALRVLEAMGQHGQDTMPTKMLRAEMYYLTARPKEARRLLDEVMVEVRALPEDDPVALKLSVHLTHNLQVLAGAEN